ncbi:MAG: DoxX family protein [Verrucomicrobia bacterium]|nr:DoxX family protein [Verrucomicrobiota bacterium]
MRTNPFSDVLDFLAGTEWTNYVMWLLLVATLLIAGFNLRRDPEQRSFLHLWAWLTRVFIGCLWWQQSLWKLPPTYTDNPDGSGGLHYWVEEMARWASTGIQRQFVKDIVLPHFYFFAPQVYFGEVLVAVSLILGLFSRVGAFLGALMAINLWLGLYRSPSEWPWTYFFLVLIQLTFVFHPPGRSWGIDAFSLRKQAESSDEEGHWGCLRRLLR